MNRSLTTLLLAGTLALTAPFAAHAANTPASDQPVHGLPWRHGDNADNPQSPPAGGQLSAKDRAVIDLVQKYLNSIHTIRSEFLQVSSNGGQADGMLYIERPDKLRLDYRPPATTQVYADGSWLVSVDTALESVTHVPLTSTPAGFLMADTIKLSGDVTVTRVVENEKTIVLALQNTGHPDQGTFYVVFNRNPMRLQGWTIVDAQGMRTHVTLLSPQFNVPVPHKVFVFDETKYDQPVE